MNSFIPCVQKNKNTIVDYYAQLKKQSHRTPLGKRHPEAEINGDSTIITLFVFISYEFLYYKINSNS